MSRLILSQICVDRNHYGGQCQSFEARLRSAVPELNSDNAYAFIRAPYVQAVTDTGAVTSLAFLDGAADEEHPVAVRQGNILATSFHPELSPGSPWMPYFIHNIVKASRS